MATDLAETETEIGTIYKFGCGGNGQVLLVRGWGEPEGGFVWSEGKAATLTLPAREAKNTLSLSFSLWGYVPTGLVSQEVLLFVNGGLCGFFQVGARNILKVDHKVTTDSAIDVIFYLPSATSPLQAEQKNDRRQLGIALAAIQIS